jgi:hypothetical protein
VSRDPGKLKVFRLADELVVEVYRVTARFPPEERYGRRTPSESSAGSGLQTSGFRKDAALAT